MGQEDVSDDEVTRRWAAAVEAVAHAQHVLLRDIETAGIPAQWFSALYRLLHAERHRMPMTHLARELSMTSGGFTKLADRLGREGLIERRGEPIDRRVIYATLTDAGVATAQRVSRMYREAVREHLLNAVPAAAIVDIADTLRTLTTALDAAAPPDVHGQVELRDPRLPERRSRQR